MKKAIHTRGLTSFFTLFGFLIMSVTGLILYIVPAGRVAYWVNWEFLGMTKTDWGNIHILSSILFITAGAFHTYFNWTPLMNYFKSRVTRRVKLRRELLIASAVSIWVVVSALFPFPPLSYLLDLNEFIKDSWIVSDEYEPPFGHAELLSLKVFSKKMDIDLEKAVQELTDNGIRFDSPDEILEDIARSNNVSPMDLYLMIKKFEPAPEPEELNSYTPESIEGEFSGTGIGNKSLNAVCEGLGLSPAIALARLETAGISASADQTLKALAETGQTAPLEIMKTIIIDGYQPLPESDAVR